MHVRETRRGERDRPERSTRRRGPRRPRLDPAGGQAAAPPRGPGHRPAAAADPHRVGVPRPPRGRRPGDGGPAARRPHPDRRARGRHPGRALRDQGEQQLVRRERLPRPGAERAAQHGGGVRRHRQGPQRGALRRRGQLGRGRPGGPGPLHRARAEVRRQHRRPGHQGPDRAQGRAADQPGQPARPLPGVRAERVDDRHQPQAAGHRAVPAEGHPAPDRARGRRRDHPYRRRGRQRGRADPRRRAAQGAVGDHPAEGGAAPRARPPCCTPSRTWSCGSSATSSTRTSPSWSSPATMPGR